MYIIVVLMEESTPGKILSLLKKLKDLLRDIVPALTQEAFLGHTKKVVQLLELWTRSVRQITHTHANYKEKFLSIVDKCLLNCNQAQALSTFQK